MRITKFFIISVLEYRKNCALRQIDKCLEDMSSKTCRIRYAQH